LKNSVEENPIKPDYYSTTNGVISAKMKENKNYHLFHNKWDK
jgi:hypothetical protein